MPSSVSVVLLAFAFLLALIALPLAAGIVGGLAVMWECFLFYAGGT